MQSSTNPALDVFTSRLAALAPLEPTDLQQLQALGGQIAQIRAHSDAIVPGQKVDHACLVVDGLLASFIQLRDGNRQTTALHIAGDVANLHTVATPKSGMALEALTTTTIVRIPHDRLRQIASSSPRLSSALWAYSAVDATILAQWTVNIGRRTAQQRLAHFLCEMGLRLEAAGYGDRCDFQLDATQAQLGDALGLTTVHVNRTFKALRVAGILAVHCRSIRVDDWSSLVQAGEFDSAYLQLSPAMQCAA